MQAATWHLDAICCSLEVNTRHTKLLNMKTSLAVLPAVIYMYQTLENFVLKMFLIHGVKKAQ